jgi:LTXXQ motif family protein
MLKSLLAGTALLAVVGTSMVYAQQNAPAGPGNERHAQMSPEDRSAFLDARVAALKVGLKLTSDQEKNWPAFEQAYRDFAKVRGDQFRAFRERAEQHQDNVNPIDRLKRRADAMTARAAALTRLAAAAGPLYQSLDDAQKGRFELLARVMHEHRREHFAFWREHEHHPDQGDQH